MSAQTQESSRFGRNIRFRKEFRGTTRLSGFYLFLSLATLVGVFFLRDNATMVTPAVWIRCSIVAATSILLVLLTAAAARGSAGGYMRLRISSAILLVAVIVILVLPGDFPLWIKAEQAGCGLLLAGVVYNVNRAKVRSLFVS
ncbi:hypothetical protein GCM10009765_43680 [Fodinicola feengrottensis]|uniref:Uncharacterized protein n=2 Tax=Fodinicola feengrottensis TaxID=435914 RepID=A0ABN2HKP0_9ACTN